MDSKEPFLNTGLITYAWVLGISIWGGVTSYFEKKEPFSWMNLFAHLCSSSFAGLMTYFLCQYGEIPGPLTGVLCGVASHLGTPALIKLAMKLKFVKQFFEDDSDKK